MTEYLEADRREFNCTHYNERDVHYFGDLLTHAGKIVEYMCSLDRYEIM